VVDKNPLIFLLLEVIYAAVAVIDQTCTDLSEAEGSSKYVILLCAGELFSLLCMSALAF
jgi:hypothetical protein